MITYILPPAMQQLADSIRGKSLHRQVQKVQLFFNRYPYFILEDKHRFVTPTELHEMGKGDCKAHACSKYFVLHAAGVPLDKLWLIYTRRPQDRVPHMILMAGDLLLDLKAFVYSTSNTPYIPLIGINHEWKGMCENAPEAWRGFGDPREIIWDFKYYNFDTWFWRLMHIYTFWSWGKFFKRLEAEVEQKKSFADSLKVTPFERAVAELGVVPDTRHVSPETEAEVSEIFTQSGHQLSPELFNKLSARAQKEMQGFIRHNQSGLMAIANKLGVKL